MLTPIGAKPGGIAVATYEVTATVVGGRCFQEQDHTPVCRRKAAEAQGRPGVNLSKVQVGDQIVAVVTEGVALTVTKA